MRKRPKQQCWSVNAADFGYGPIEEYECFEPATHIAKDYNPYDDVVDKIRLCKFHTKDFSKAYRYRRVAE